jgi:hypothetical protein
MKKLLCALALAMFSFTGHAHTFITPNGVLMSNVCRSGSVVFMFTGQYMPVGSPCWFNLGGNIFTGFMTAE